MEVRRYWSGEQHIDQGVVVQVVELHADDHVLAHHRRGRVARHEGDARHQRQLPAALRLQGEESVRAAHGQGRGRLGGVLQEHIGVPVAVSGAELLYRGRW